MATQEAPRADMVTDERGWTAMHEDLSAFIKSETGYNADPTTIRLAFALRNEYRKTDRYTALREARAALKVTEDAAKAKVATEKAAQREVAKTEAEADKVTKAQERLAAKAAKTAAAETAKADRAEAKAKAAKVKADANA
jgi:hypothetical protein